jgi:hypothetical protein
MVWAIVGELKLIVHARAIAMNEERDPWLTEREALATAPSITEEQDQRQRRLHREGTGIAKRAREAAQRHNEKQTKPVHRREVISATVPQAISPREMLDRFGLIEEQAFAAMIGVAPKSLKNRPRSDLPEFVKVGRRRLFVEQSVREYLDSRRDQKGRR